MRLLEDASWTARTYDLPEVAAQAMLDDVEVIKRTLVEAVASSHLEHTGRLEAEKKAAALSFLDFFHNIFTTNYDLLPYWVNLSHPVRPQWRDGFRADDDPDATYVVFGERLGRQKGLFYLHGALHFYVAEGELRKHTWSRTGIPLTHSIRESLSKGEYPLFVSEGSPEKKLEQIQRSGYLWYCLDKLARIESPLVVFGHALGPSDSHIGNVVADNLELPALYIGLFGNPESDANLLIIRAADRIRQRRRDRFMGKRGGKGKELEIHYFDSATANVWGSRV